MITKKELEEGVKGQTLFCVRKNRMGRFFTCKLDGEKIEVPTDSVITRTSEKVRAQNDMIGVNPVATFFTDKPRIKVKAGWQGENEYVGDFTNIEVEDY